MAEKLYRNVDGVKVELTAEEVEATLAERAADKVKQEANQYIYDRQSEYPSYADQFDQIFHEGIDKWKETIQAVKDANPKP
tara:strand:+ start:820 stop:1062 length:243 start_codon:yes stop_codon:yes gene_type:complete